MHAMPRWTGRTEEELRTSVDVCAKLNMFDAAASLEKHARKVALQVIFWN